MYMYYATTLMACLILVKLTVHAHRDTCLELLAYAMVFGVIADVTESRALRMCLVIFYGLQLTVSVLVPLLKVLL